MAAVQHKSRKKTRKLREFVVRLEQPGLYDRLYNESIRRTRKEGRRVAMTEIVREAIEEHLAAKAA